MTDALSSMHAQKIHGNRIRYFSRKCLEWYESHGRDFPWRKPGEPIYRLVVTEVLLQRTRAATVAGIYHEFFEKYPNWESIASSSVRDMGVTLRPLGLWQQRSERLVGFARAVVKNDGRLPRSIGDASRFPAAGQYVTNAILLFEGIERLPLLDAGMARVIERFFGPRKLADIRHDPYLQTLAKRIVANENAVDLNWAILDLSAVVCTPSKPRCPDCPLRQKCGYSRDAHSAGQ